MSRRSFIGAVFAGTVQASRRAEDARDVAERVFAAVNRERRSRRLPALSWSNTLAEEARRHSERMATGQFFSHSDASRGTLRDRLLGAGIRYRACAENLCMGSPSPDTASAAVTAWLGSRGHRSKLLSRAYRETGVGVSVNSAGRYLITQIFVTTA